VNAKEKRPGATPLIVTAFEGHKEVVEQLVAKGADMNAQDNEGNTALSLASQRGHTAVVELLKAKGAKAESTAEKSKETKGK
jgi:ankyrin repeat protein